MAGPKQRKKLKPKEIKGKRLFSAHEGRVKALKRFERSKSRAKQRIK